MEYQAQLDCPVRAVFARLAGTYGQPDPFE